VSDSKDDRIAKLIRKIAYETEAFELLSEEEQERAILEIQIAKIIDPTIYEPLRSRLMTAWTDSSISQENADRYMEENEKAAFDKAREIITYIKGVSRASRGSAE
jgi:hypothetical protein